MNTTEKNCKTCGKPFKRSFADYTVNCPSCRAAAKPAPSFPAPTSRELEVMKARSAARTARRVHGVHSPEYKAAEAAYFRIAD